MSTKNNQEFKWRSSFHVCYVGQAGVTLWEDYMLPWETYMERRKNFIDKQKSDINKLDT